MMLEYEIHATRTDAHASLARCGEAEIVLDTDVQDRTDAFNPAELLLAPADELRHRRLAVQRYRPVARPGLARGGIAS